MAMTRKQVKQHIQRLAHGQDSFTSDGQRLALDLLDTDAALRTKLEAMEQTVGRLEELSKIDKQANDDYRVIRANNLATIHTLTQRVTALEMAIQPVAFMLEEFEIVPIGLSREQELYWKKSVKDIRALLPPPGAHTKETP